MPHDRYLLHTALNFHEGQSLSSLIEFGIWEQHVSKAVVLTETVEYGSYHAARWELVPILQRVSVLSNPRNGIRWEA